MTTESNVVGLYTQILGRSPDPAGLANAVAAVNGGATFAQIALSLAMSPEAQARISGLYLSELGRAADGAGLANVTNALANGASLAQVGQAMATSPEAQAAVARLYQTELGRSPDGPGAASFTRYLAGGGSLAGIATSLAGGPEAQAQIGFLYQTVLDRMPLPAELASSSQYLAGGGSFAGVRAGLAMSDEAAQAVQSAYVSGGVKLGDIPSTEYQIAAGESELLSGVGLTTLQAELEDDKRGGRAQVPVSNQVSPVTPAMIRSTPVNPYVYSLGTNAALNTVRPEKVSFNDGYNAGLHALLGNAIISGFNPATDILKISYQQATSLSQGNPLGELAIVASDSPAGPGTTISTSNINITLLNVTPASLHDANFRFQ